MRDRPRRGTRQFEWPPNYQGTYDPFVPITLFIPGIEALTGEAVVDTGADTSLVPWEAVQSAFSSFEDLPLAPSSRGIFGSLEVRSCPGARLVWEGLEVCSDFRVAPPDSLSDGRALLGREDFLAKVVIQFNGHRRRPTFDVEILEER